MKRVDSLPLDLQKGQQTLEKATAVAVRELGCQIDTCRSIKIALPPYPFNPDSTGSLEVAMHVIGLHEIHVNKSNFSYFEIVKTYF
jgi:hypothetical protein